VRALYLPVLHLDRCTPSRRRVDVVLAIDTSTSMLAPTQQGGPRKIDAAVDASRGFLELLNMPRDQAALVTFNERGYLNQGLTGDRQLLEEALAEVSVAPGTAIDGGLDAARWVLKYGSRNPLNRPVVVLLTDGQSTVSRDTSALRAADRLKREGAAVFTIALGQDINFELLEAIASEPAYSFRAPSTEVLATIYALIAATIPCP
jgi:Mg-chelatase subunit ChlD